MTFLPIVTRELRVTSRRAKTYWSRAGVAAVMLLVASWIILVTRHQSPSSRAFELFATLAGAMMFVGGFSGMGATADLLSSEKRNGTLGLLFLTPLRGYDVVLGKLCAGSLTVLYGMMSVTPIMALPLLMGGVSAGEFGRMALLMLNTMLLSLAVGICISSISRGEKRARGATLLVILVLAGGLPLLGAWLEYGMNIRGLAQWFLIFSPGYAFACAWDKTRVIPWVGFWGSMLTIHLTTWALLGLACWFTPRTWQDRPAGSRWRFIRFFQSAAMGSAEGGAAFRRRLLDQNAFYWLNARARFKPLFLWGTLLAITAVWLGFGMKYPRDMFDPPFFVVMAVAWNGILKSWVSSEATRQIAHDRKSGSIELLLSTSLTIKDITRGLGLSLRRQFGAPLLVVLLAECFLMVVGAQEMSSNHTRVLWIAMWVCGMTMLVADVITMYALGLWQSAVARGPTQAAGATAFRILALPWLLYLALGSLWAVAGSLGYLPRVPRPEWVFWLGSWMLIALAVDLFFGLRAWRGIQSRFREVASRQGAAPGWGAALGRLFGRLKAGPPVKR